MRVLVKKITRFIKLLFWTSFLVAYGMVIILTVIMESLVQLAR